MNARPILFTVTADDRMVVVEAYATRTELTISEAIELLNQLVRGINAASRQVGEKDGRAFEQAMAQIRQQRSPT